MSWRQRIFDKINSLPNERKSEALREFELHEYCAKQEKHHNVLIADNPHPLMILDGDRFSKSGKWYMGGMN